MTAFTAFPNSTMVAIMAYRARDDSKRRTNKVAKMNRQPTVDRQKEIDQNLEFFLRELPKILADHNGKYALLRHQKIIAYYDTVSDAVSAGNQLYSDRLFSVQQVTQSGTDLGYFSYAVPLGATQ
jgi:hypothetical protein